MGNFHAVLGKRVSEMDQKLLNLISICTLMHSFLPFSDLIKWITCKKSMFDHFLFIIH